MINKSGSSRKFGGLALLGAALLAISVVAIGGQTLSLLLTLLATPVVYSLLDDLGLAFRRRRGFVIRSLFWWNEPR